MQQSRRLTIVEGVCSSSGSNENEARGEHRLPDHLHSFSTFFSLPSFLSLSIFPSNPCQSPWLLRTDCVGHLQVATSGLRQMLTPFVAFQLFAFSHKYIPPLTSQMILESNTSTSANYSQRLAFTSTGTKLCSVS